MYSGHLTDVAAIAVGHKEDENGGTGVTVILARKAPPPAWMSEAAHRAPESVCSWARPTP